MKKQLKLRFQRHPKSGAVTNKRRKKGREKIVRSIADMRQRAVLELYRRLQGEVVR